MAEPEQSNAAGELGSESNVDHELSELRDQIDRVDLAILEKLNERAGLVRTVGGLKHATGAPVYEEARERHIVNGLVERNTGPFPDSGLAPVFREIISATRSLEDRLPIAFMGPEGTFSHLAATHKFGRLAHLAPVATIPEVFACVERGEAEMGVVPVENTTEGVVTQTLDALAESDVFICGEVQLRIANHLVSRSGRLEEVRRVVSHPQPLAQCRQWLDRHLPGIDRVEATSTTAAAALAVDDAALAAICSSIAAETYGLREIAGSIEDRRDNTTRFLVIGHQRPAATGNDLTSAVFTIRKDEPGGLHNLLQPFARAGINLTSIQLRPIKGKPWEYLFFLDFEGHASEERVARALAEVGTIVHSQRTLGSFPRAEGERGPRDGAGE